MKRLRFVDFWEGFKPQIRFSELFSLLTFDFEITEEDDNIDFLFCSVFGNKHKSLYAKHKILINWETCGYFDVFDIKFTSETRSDWCPLLLDRTKELKSKYYNNNIQNNKYFCNALYSNETDLRTKFIGRLLERFGNDNIAISGNNKFNNTTRNDCTTENKYSWLLEHKSIFNICPENTWKDGYNTEKIRDAYMTHHIPVYWGSPNEYIPEGSYVMINPDNPDETIDKMIEISQNKELQEKMLSLAPIDKLCEKTA